MSPEELSEKRVGTTVREKWTLERLLGIGGMASVYAARHKIGRHDALKILHPDIAKSPQLRERFEQEAHAVNAFKHPGVVEIRDVDVTEDGAPFLVMELLEGEPLSARMRSEPPLAADELLRIVAETLDVLASAHARGIIHRDVKPDNLFLTTNGVVKVLDFGIARVRSSAGRMHTKAGVTLGTMAYMPPEQAKGQEIDARADVYAVGATMFKALAGRIVHAAETDAELVIRATSDHAPPLASVAPGVPAGVCAIVDRALAFDREHRYPDAATMKRDVDLVRAGETPAFASSAPPLPPRPPPSSFSFGAASAPTGAAAAASGVHDNPTVVPVVRRSSPPPTARPAPSANDAPTRAASSPHVAATVVSAARMPTAALPSSRAPISARLTAPLAAVAAAPAPNAAAPTARVVAPPPRTAAAAPVLTPYGELSAYVKKVDRTPNALLTIVAVVGGVVALAVLVGVILWMRARDSAEPPMPGLTPPAATALPSH